MPRRYGIIYVMDSAAYVRERGIYGQLFGDQIFSSKIEAETYANEHRWVGWKFISLTKEDLRKYHRNQMIKEMK